MGTTTRSRGAPLSRNGTHKVVAYIVTMLLAVMGLSAPAMASSAQAVATSYPPSGGLECTTEYEWVLKDKEWQYEKVTQLYKEQFRFKKQVSTREWVPGVDEVSHTEWRYRNWLQPSEHKQVKTTWRFVDGGTTTINGVAVPGTWSNSGGSPSWYELPSAVTNAAWGPSGPPASIIPPSATEANPATGTVPLSTYGAPSSAGSVQYRAWLVPGGEWSGWSSWSKTNPGSATDTRQVETRTVITTPAVPGYWTEWSGWTWFTPHTYSDWLDAGAQIPTGIPSVGSVDPNQVFQVGDTARYRYIQHDTRTVSNGATVEGPEWYKKGEQPQGWTLVVPNVFREVIVDGPVWSATPPGGKWEKTGETRKVDCLVVEPLFTPGDCFGPGSVYAPDADAYTWQVTGPDDAKTYTAVAKPGHILKGQTVFGPFDVSQTSWTDSACQPMFEVVQECGYVEITYANHSKWDRWPDYSFTGDTKEPVDYGSGPTWNTVKVASGETRVIFERYFEEDYWDGGPIEVWFQDILGAERDIDTPRVTLTVETDCAPDEIVPVLPEVTPQVCTPPDGELTGGTITLPESDDIEYSVWDDETQVTNLDDVAPGEYTVVAEITTEWRVFGDLPGWDVSEDGLTATTTITVEAAEDCFVEPPPPLVEYTEWEDGTYDCGDTTVEQTRTRVETPYRWDGESYVLDPDNAVTTVETQVRNLTDTELQELAELCFEIPPRPEPRKYEVSGSDLSCEGELSWAEFYEVPTVWDPEAGEFGEWVEADPVLVDRDTTLRPLTEKEALDLGCIVPPKPPADPAPPTFVDATFACVDDVWAKSQPGKYTIPTSPEPAPGTEKIVYLVNGNVVPAGTYTVTGQATAVVTATAVVDGKTVNLATWSHVFKESQVAGTACAELPQTGANITVVAVLAAMLTMLGLGAFFLSRSRRGIKSS